MSTSKNNNGKRPAEAVDGKFTDAGRAKKTKGGRGSAWQCFRRFEQMRQDDLMAELNETDDDDAKGEIIQTSLIAFVDYMATTPILQQNSTGKVLGEDGCKQYLGSVKEVIKDNTSHYLYGKNMKRHGTLNFEIP